MIKVLLAKQSPTNEAMGNFKFVLNNLQSDLKFELERMHELKNSQEHLYNICRITFLRKAIRQVASDWRTFKDLTTQKRRETLNDFQQSLFDTSMQKVGTAHYENYLRDNKTPFSQVYFGQGDDADLPEIAYDIS